MIKVRTSEVLKTRDPDSIFFEGQHHAEERIIDYDKNTIIQNDVSKTRLKAYVENKDYDFVKQVEMVTIISEGELNGIKIFIKRRFFKYIASISAVSKILLIYHLPKHIQ